MNKAVAYNNNSVVFIAWQYDKLIPGCLGFDIRRTDLKTKVMTHMPTWVPFQGETNAEWKSQGSDVWPIQKFSWRDFGTQSGGSYQYQVVPMVGDLPACWASGERGARHAGGCSGGQLPGAEAVHGGR